MNRALLRSGTTIGEMNCVRRHLSAVKGGRLAAAAHPARVVTLAISDVPGDDPAVIASGPTVPDSTNFAEARALLAHHGIEPPPAVAAHLDKAEDETPKPGDPRLSGDECRMIATPLMALEAMAAEARALGLAPLIMGDALEGEAREVGTVLAGVARSVRAHGHPLPAPAVLLSGGETTVTIRAPKPGRGGRNTECLLGLALALAAEPCIWALAADTDGVEARKARRAPWSRPTPWPTPAPPAWTRAPCSPRTTATASSPRSATWCPPAPPSPTSTTCVPCWSADSPPDCSRSGKAVPCLAMGTAAPHL